MARLLSSSSITGDSVVNASGDSLGSIKDLMIDTESGRIEYAVLSFGGMLGLGDKLFAIPFGRFQVDFDNKRMILNVDQQRLENAPGFDKNDWPDFADPSFRSSVDKYYAYFAVPQVPFAISRFGEHVMWCSPDGASEAPSTFTQAK